MHFAPNNSAPARKRRSGFTLVEVLVATSVLGLLAGSAVWTLSQANINAAIGRFRTGAENAAQNQIDLFLTEGPFNPQNGDIPTICAVGTTTDTVTIYSEPNGTGGQKNPVSATRTTVVVKTPGIPLVSGADLNLYSCNVTVSFTYRSKNYSVQLNALRSSDI